MKQPSKHIAFLLVSVVLFNGLFAAQMTISMTEFSAQAQVSESHKPCHGDEVETDKFTTNEATDCCERDCSSCLLTSSVNALSVLNITNNPQSSVVTLMASHPLSAYKTNLYRPPILI